ncbi:hypothetical protein DAD186_20810 [Dermabacter vaginalis]|uniref:Fatty acid ABC transporter ATP-binding/permease protein n=1 Tax=Dermabacter vaginalis TaxID=1630135 RepID=A0A1B0ZKV7_9MICO|nr:ABC transporter ATP-binding protein [Dermabacter vaginalis]ANP28631.1 hypothetical protein DAD186_20810 [Dermabacter vaginalis]
MKALSRIFRFTSELWPLYLAIIVSALLTTAMTLVIPFLIGSATDTATAAVAGTLTRDEALHDIIMTAVWIFVAFMASALIQNIGGYFGDVMGNRLRAMLSVRYYDKLLNLPQRWYDEELTGTIVSRLNRSIAEIGTFAKIASNAFISMIITAIAVLAISAWYWWPLALILFIMFPLYLWLTSLTSVKWQRLEGEKNEQIDIASGRFAEVVGQIRVVKSFVREKSELASFTKRFNSTDAITKEQSVHWHKMDVYRLAALNLAFAVLYLIIFIRTVQGDFSVGDMVILIQLMNLVRNPIENMSWVVDTSQRAVAGSKDYFAVMDTKVEVWPTLADGRSFPEAVEGAPRIVFDHVNFAYEENHDVLHDMSFHVDSGEKVALVGESGGGKSTIVNLILGLYRTRTGEVRLRGHNVNDLPIDVVRSRVGVVFQDAALFSGTIRENIAYGRPDATDEEVREAARRANASQFIERFNDGYDTLIGERGLKLSGGQRQRIAVARAMLKDAPILVLDEATSALDTKAERQVQAGLDALMENRTSIIIAHRLSTIAGVDRIITLRDGRIDEIGTPAELAASGGIYAELLALQNAGGAEAKKLLERFGITG